MEFRILGPLEVHDGSGAVRVPGAKERALLADLLVHAGRVVAADRLVEDLWGDTPPAKRTVVWGLVDPEDGKELAVRFVIPSQVASSGL